ncbi:MAG: glycoside hydrolase [Pseudomonadota bacterium]
MTRAMLSRLLCCVLVMLGCFGLHAPAQAQDDTAIPISEALYQSLRYRLIGPFRAGRTVGAVGVPSQPNVFYIGVNNGGVWKTDDYGRTWEPIFDDAPTGSVGDIAVSPSHPDIIYVGTGEGLHRPDLSTGEGIFKSEDGGANWRHAGLGDIQQVGRILVHPQNPDLVYVAGMGHPYGPNEERGVFRSSDGGGSWEKVLYVNHNTGASRIEFDPNDPATIYASLWEHREGPWENARFSGPNSGLYKSTDGGTTWRRLSGGLPGAEQGLGKTGVGVAPGNSARVYAVVDAREGGGIYRSDNGGDSWELTSTDRRLWRQGGGFGELRVHPDDQDLLFLANIAAYSSRDGGVTWTSNKGAPGGDDYQRIWINPERPNIRIYAADQGATITVNGGRTWSSWYNQPTAQLYHVSTDDQFPYWVYGGQQESGAIGVASRGPGGQISFRDWMGVGADEYAYVVADPLNPHFLYGGRVVRFDRRTGQTRNIAPEALRSGKYRVKRSMPLSFHPADPNMLLYATNVLWKTTNGGEAWSIISPDLSREQPAVSESIGDFRTPELETMERLGVIYALGLSPLNRDLIWAGTDDGLIHVTAEGGESWRDVTPPELRAWDKVSNIDAGHFDQDTAYAAINAIRLDDMRPHIFRTHNGGTTWERIVTGLEGAGPVNVVREDPKQPGLLFAGTERAVYFSSDDGEHWHPLRMNMPASSVRDLVVHEDDLVVGTHGRSIWIMDNISPLRELAAAARAGRTHLFSPATAVRVRGNLFLDTPIPPEEPAGENPPDGAILDYYLPQDVDRVKLEILDGNGDSVRAFSSDDNPEVLDPNTLPHPTYWIRPPEVLGTGHGHHRFVWDLRYPAPEGVQRGYDIAAVYGNTSSDPVGPFVHPGVYTIRLTVDGAVYENGLSVVLDPRVEISGADLELQTRYSLQVLRASERVQRLRERIDEELVAASGSRREHLLALRGEGDAENPNISYGSITESPLEAESIVGLQEKLIYMLKILQTADARPTTQAIAAVEALSARVGELEGRF